MEKYERTVQVKAVEGSFIPFIMVRDIMESVFQPGLRIKRIKNKETQRAGI